jgi:N-acyl-L-homoserine lactone synthetase
MVAVVACASESDHAGSENSFSDRIAQLLARIDCRRADSGEQREAIFRLRYQAYLRDGAIPPNSSASFSDPYDETGNVYLFGLYIDDELAGSIRIHVGARECPNFPSLEVFPDILQPELDAGKVIIDPTRFVTDENLARVHRGLPYAVARLCGMAAEYFNADHLLAAVRVEHQAFYRRMFKHRLICEPRPYPHLTKPISLMTIDYPTVWPDAVRRYPFYGSTRADRRMLFERALLQVNIGLRSNATTRLAGW